MRVRVPLQVPFDLLQFEALDLAVQGAGGDTGRSNKKLTVSDALVIAKLCRE